MNRIDARFESLRKRGACGLIPFFTGGDPAGTDPAALMHAMVASGADLIEVGMPFSDPMADGPVIQAASERALRAGTRLSDVLDAVSRFRREDTETPVILMGYLNPIERMGHDNFVQRASEAGIDGVLLVDMPVEEESDFREQLRAAGVQPIMLIAPTTTGPRRDRILRVAGGFVYYIRLKGVTGSGAATGEGLLDELAALRAASTLPLAVGFGISDAPGAAHYAGHADAVVMGSALVACLAAADDPLAAARSFLAPVRKALDEVVSKSA